MSKATKILNTVNKGFEKVGLTYPTYNWSKDVAVDQEMVNEIHKMDEFIPIENEKFLYTSLCVRRYGLCATRSNLLVTDNRIIFWNTYWQVNYRSSLLPLISVLDINSLKRLKKVRHFYSAYTISLSIIGKFITGSNPDYFFSSQLRKENIQLMKNQNDFRFFREAIEQHGIEIEELEKD